MKAGNIYLIPSPIAERGAGRIIAPFTKELILELNLFFVENIRTSRRYFSSLGIPNIDKIRFETLNKDTTQEEINHLIQHVKKGLSAGVLSEAGCPGIADPGSGLVKAAHLANITIIPLPGPSSIFMALMASGLNGQRFVFHGYLPIEKKARRQKIREMEFQSKQLDQTQIFMETPYRNQQVLKSLLENLNESTLLCIASDITGKSELIRTKTIKSWRKKTPDVHKKPTIFLISGT
jgi:16S rRNA (cytidine1402-2'-O)-methyltransferase